MTQKIVINRCGKAHLFSEAGLLEYVKRKYAGVAPTDFGAESVQRDASELIAMFEERGGRQKYGGFCSHIQIVEVPDDFKWKVQTIKGSEFVSADVVE